MTASAAWRAAAAAVAAIAAASGCAGANPVVPPPLPATPAEAAALYPLELGFRWAYDIEKGGERILAVYEVVERSGDTAQVQAGDQRLAYKTDAQGIARFDGGEIGDYVLRNPIELGAQWSLGDGKAKVVAVGEELTLDAGKFSGCATVEESRTDPVRLVRTTFAPGVGPVRLEVQLADDGKLITMTHATLRGVTKPGEDPLR